MVLGRFSEFGEPDLDIGIAAPFSGVQFGLAMPLAMSCCKKTAEGEVAKAGHFD